jgi:hypothetical protein
MLENYFCHRYIGNLCVKAQGFCPAYSEHTPPNLAGPFNPNHSSAQPHLQDPRANPRTCASYKRPPLPGGFAKCCKGVGLPVKKYFKNF